jgi:hypothetical protein
VTAAAPDHASVNDHDNDLGASECAIVTDDDDAQTIATGADRFAVVHSATSTTSAHSTTIAGDTDHGDSDDKQTTDNAN